MTAEVVSIGTELLLGQIVDTDAAYLARRLSDLGVSVYRRATVGDNFERGVEIVKGAFERAEIVFLIGGLGPTLDDLTRDIIARVCDAPVARDEAIVAHLTDWFARRNYTLGESILRQADVPDGAVAIPNPVGTAPGLWLAKSGKIVVALPGPPNEFIPMVENEVVPRLQAVLGANVTTIRSRTLRIVDMGESEVEARVKDLMASSDVTVAPYAKMAEVHLRVTALRATAELADAVIAPVVDEIFARLGDVVYGLGDDPLEKVVVDALVSAGQTVATAESCTGGTLAGRITAVSGSSEVFGTGVVSYANDAKAKILGIDPGLIARVGAVSEEVAGLMASGVRRISGADFGLGITGIAGPGGGSDEKPVGLVYIGIAGPFGARVEQRIFAGSRDDIRFRATQVALDLLRRALRES